MMLGYRLLRLVETHSEALAAGLLEKTQQSPLLSGYRDVPPERTRATRVRNLSAPRRMASR